MTEKLSIPARDEPLLKIATRGPPDDLDVNKLVEYVFQRAGSGSGGVPSPISLIYKGVFSQLNTVFGLTGTETLIRRASSQSHAKHPLLTGLTDAVDPEGYFSRMEAGPQPPDEGTARSAVEGLLIALFHNLERLIGIEVLTRLIEHTPYASENTKAK